MSKDSKTSQLNVLVKQLWDLLDDDPLGTFGEAAYPEFQRKAKSLIRKYERQRRMYETD
jgi:hypothetical protein